MKTILWEVSFLAPPKAIRACKKCGAKTTHIPSGSFRVNAQQKHLDVWLIYRCAHCKTTWNLTLYTRVSPKALAPSLLKGFTENDAALARGYAMDAKLLRQNGAEVEPPAYEIRGEAVGFTEDARLKIACEHPAGLRLAKLLREKLALTRKELDALVADGVLRLENGADILRFKMQPDVEVLICAQARGRGSV